MTTDDPGALTAGYQVRDCFRAATPDPAWLMSADFPDPFAIELVVTHDEVDTFGHVNNTVYCRWMEACAWAHSADVGLPPAECRALNRGMALRGLEVEFEKPAFVGWTIIVANWITEVGKLRAVRRFQVMTPSGETLARAVGRYVCISLSTGAPTRMPAPFAAGYVLRAGTTNEG